MYLKSISTEFICYETQIKCKRFAAVSFWMNWGINLAILAYLNGNARSFFWEIWFVWNSMNFFFPTCSQCQLISFMHCMLLLLIFRLAGISRLHCALQRRDICGHIGGKSRWAASGIRWKCLRGRKKPLEVSLSVLPPNLKDQWSLLTPQFTTGIRHLWIGNCGGQISRFWCTLKRHRRNLKDKCTSSQ